jgi:hypothetical protein
MDYRHFYSQFSAAIAATLLRWRLSYAAAVRCIRLHFGGRLAIAVALSCSLFFVNPPLALATSSQTDNVAPLEEPPRSAPNQPDASDIPSETVSQFVTAYLAVVELIEQREADLQRAETEAESLQKQREIQAQAFQLIQETGLTRQQYWQLLGLANADADFRERVLAQVEEASLAQ